MQLPLPYFAQATQTTPQFSGSIGANLPQASCRNDIAEKAFRAEPGNLQTPFDSGDPLLNIENIGSRLNLELWTQNGRQEYQEGEPLRMFVAASQDCYLTLVSVDPTGEVVCLIPNGFAKKHLRLRANEVIGIPNETMQFKDPAGRTHEIVLRARPPHGRTIVKAFATTRLPILLNPPVENEFAEAGRAKGFRAELKVLNAPLKPVAPAKPSRCGAFQTVNH